MGFCDSLGASFNSTFSFHKSNTEFKIETFSFRARFGNMTRFKVTIQVIVVAG